MMENKTVIDTMRLDKFLKVSRILKRRAVANEACDAGKVEINGRAVKPSHNVKAGDVITITMGGVSQSFKILKVAAAVKKDEARDMYCPI